MTCCVLNKNRSVSIFSVDTTVGVVQKEQNITYLWPLKVADSSIHSISFAVVVIAGDLFIHCSENPLCNSAPGAAVTCECEKWERVCSWTRQM